MAKYYSSTFGKISGKHGTAVAVIMKDGTTYLRKYTKPSNPRTDKQQAHRYKFALSSRALVPFNPIFKETIGITNGISTARSYAFKNAIVGEYPSFYMDYERLMFSFGPIERLHNPSATINQGTISLNWDFEKVLNSQGNDSINLVVFNKEANQSIHLKDVALRSERECEIKVHDSWADSDLYVWAYVRYEDRSSDSVFVGKLQVDNNDKSVSSCADISVSCDDEKQIGSSMYSIVNQFATFFIMIIYNLLRMFGQEVISTKNNISVLIQRVSGLIAHKEYIYNSKVFNIKITSALSAVYDRLYDECRSIFAPIPIPMSRCDDKLGLLYNYLPSYRLIRSFG